MERLHEGIALLVIEDLRVTLVMKEGEWEV